MGDTNVVRKADATLPEGALGIALPADGVRVGSVRPDQKKATNSETL